jgi:uncharacterized damage-inducible protein DinB
VTTSKRARKTGKSARKKANSSDTDLRSLLQKFLSGGSAHADFEKAMKNVPRSKRSAIPSGAPHSLWQLAEHVRLAQADILEFATSSSYREKKFPDDYWPKSNAPTDSQWNACIRGFARDLGELKRLAANASLDLSKKIAGGDGQSYLRELILAIDHNSYHIGQMVLIRRLVGAWTEE